MKILGRVLGLLAVAAIIAAGSWLLTRRATGPQSVSGTIETDDVHVASRYGGRVVKVFAREGDSLREGQPIVELEAAELRARRDQVAALLKELENGPRPAEIAAAKADWESLVAQGDFARNENKRLQELYAQKTISDTERDQAASRAQALEQSVVAARQRYDLLAEGTRPERIAQARAQLAEIDAQWQEMTITAPVGGSRSRATASADDTGSVARERDPPYILEILNVKVGDVLPANREIATLLSTGHLWARVYVPEPWLGRIRLGQPVNVRTDSSRAEFTGLVEQISREAEFTPRNVQTVEDRVRQVFGVKVRLPADEPNLRPGMSVDVTFADVPPAPK